MKLLCSSDLTQYFLTLGNHLRIDFSEESVIIPNQQHRQDKSREPREERFHSIAFDSEDEECYEDTIDFIRRSKQRRSSVDGPRPSVSLHAVTWNLGCSVSLTAMNVVNSARR
jgi:hypothetical protein